MSADRFLSLLIASKYPAVINPEILHRILGWQEEESKAFEIVENKWQVAKVITLDVEEAG